MTKMFNKVKGCNAVFSVKLSRGRKLGTESAGVTLNLSAARLPKSIFVRVGSVRVARAWLRGCEKT